MSSKNRTTLSDIARTAGVSVATASKVVNGKADVAAQTRERVERAMEQLGYFRTSQSATTAPFIDMAFRHLDNSWTIDLIRGASDGAQKLGARIVIAQEDTLDELNATWLEEVTARRPLGAIVVFAQPSVTLAKRLASRNIPCVFIDPWGSPALGIKSVQTDNWSGGVFATRHLTELGHRRIATITGPTSVMCANARLDGYRNALMEAHIPFDEQLVRRGEFSQQSGLDMAMDLLSMRNRPTAIFAQSDFIAMGVYEAAHKLGLRIPDDLSIVGFDDIPTSQFMGPALTTVHQPSAEMASMAVQMILDAREGRAGSERVILPTTLIVRGSTCAPAQ